MDEKLRRILPRVQKPARYTGGEYGSVIKNKNTVGIRAALCYPDTYEIGMSNLGLRILYGLLNEMPDVWCERAFAPWIDMENEMRENRIPMYALESGDPLCSFDIVGFTLQYELCYTNVLNMLDLAGIPLLSKERVQSDPLIIGGGPCVYNCEPVADFFDIIWIGEAEESLPEFMELYRSLGGKNAKREELFQKAAQIEGIYVPSLYDIEYNGDGTIKAISPKNGAPQKIKKRIIRDFDKAYFPKTFVVPSIQTVHDRVILEVFRGCIRSCRFCQAGHTYRPVRAKKTETLLRQAIEQCEFSGCEEISLASLSTSDYPDLNNLCDRLLEYCEPRGISLGLPSLRADNFSAELLEKVQKVRKSGLTFAPEAGTQRLRDVINKNITEKDLLDACGTAFAGGFSSVKLYFMLGLPTETEEDLFGIAQTANHVMFTWRQSARDKTRGVRIGVSTSSFVPKPFTPFQWAAQASRDELVQKISFLKKSITGKSMTFSYADVNMSFLEGVFARGDRRLSKVISDAWRNGCRFDGWDDQMNFSAWQTAFANNGIDPDFYTVRERGADEIFPWEHMDCGVSKKYLRKSYEAGLSGKAGSDCRKACGGCGAGMLLGGGKCDA